MGLKPVLSFKTDFKGYVLYIDYILHTDTEKSRRQLKPDNKCPTQTTFQGETSLQEDIFRRHRG